MPTPAPDLATLLSYESHLEPAFCAILKAAGIRAAPAFHVELDAEGKIVLKETPFVDVILTAVTPTGHKVIMADRTERYDAWQGTIAAKLVTTRGKDSDQQPALLGTIRTVAREPEFNFSLDYHSVRTVRESGFTRGIDTINRLDWSEIIFAVNFTILGTAWTAGALFVPPQHLPPEE
jgi:hypothetical protein